MMRHTLLLLAVSAAVLMGAARAEEETVVVGADAKVGMAGYTTVSDVKSQGDIDLDLRAIEKAGSDWAAAKEIYKDGKYAVKASGEVRKIASMSTNVVANAKGEHTMHYYALGNKFWGRWDYADAHITAALDGADLEPFGMYETNTKAGSDAARKQMVKKLAAYTTVRDHAIHEMELAYKDYLDPTLGEARYEASGAVHLWDEWWAYFTGNLEDGSTEAGEVDDEGLGYGPYALAEKRAGGFGTAGKIVGNGGMSKVSWDLMFAAHAGQRLLMKPDNAEEIEGVMQCIRAVSIVPAIQGCLEYAYEASSADVISDADLPKYQAEAYAFCAAALPFLNEADPADAAAVHATVRIDSAGRPDWEIVKNAFGAINLNKMGVRCADVGALSTSQPESKHEECTDGSLSNAMADAGKCDAILMPSSSSVLRAGAGMLVAAVAAMALLV